MQTNCYICGSEIEQRKIQGFLHCSGCGFFFREKVPTAQELKEQLRKVGIRAVWGGVYAEKRLLEARRQWNWVMESCSDKGLVFDIGASGGFMLKVAREDGWEIDGNELSHISVLFAKTNYGIDLHYEEFEGIDLKEGVFDLVLAFNSLEHVLNVFTTMLKIKKILSQEGRVAVQLPLINSANSFRLFHDGPHTCEFSLKAVIGLFRKYEFNEVRTYLFDDSRGCPNLMGIFQR